MRLLITGAAGGVGGMVVQLAAIAGIKAALLGSRSEHETAVFDFVVAPVRTDPGSEGGFDAIHDTAGVLDVSNLLSEGGRLVTISDETIPEAIERRAESAVHNYVRHDRQRLREPSALAERSRLILRVAERYPLVRIEQAPERAEAGGLLGKVVITM